MRDYLRLIQRKGVFEVLSSIAIIPKRYNQIKEDLIDKISPRTLDARLIDLKESNLISTNTRLREIQEYSLNESGKSLLSILKALTINGHKKGNIVLTTENIVRIIEEERNQLNLSWQNIWPQLMEICLSKGEILTLSQTQKMNTIEEVSDAGITVRTEKGSSLVSMENLRQAWYYLVEDGHLHRGDHQKSTYRSSFICALFNHLDCVELESNRPIIIRLKTDFNQPD